MLRMFDHLPVGHMKGKLSYVLLAIAGIVLYGMGRRAARLSAELANWKQAAQHALQARTAYVGQIDSLRGLEARLRARQARLEAISGDLRATADSLAQIADTASSVGPYRSALLASQAVAAICRATLAVSDSGWTTCAQRAGLSEARAQRLDSLLRQGVKIQTCRIAGFLPCPSRGLAFLGGAIGGYLLSPR